MHAMSKRKTYLLTVLLILSSLQCFHPTFLSINSQICKFVTYICAIVLIIVACKTNKSVGKFYFYSTLGLFLCQLLSAFNAFIYYHQSLNVSLLANMQGMLYILLVPIIKSKLSVSDMEKLIMSFAFCFITCSLLNRLSPVPLFGSVDDSMDRGAARFRVIGVYWAMFALFAKANSYALCSGKKNLYWVLLSLFAIIMTLTRQNIAVSVIMGGLLFFVKAKMTKKITLIISIVCLFYIVLPHVKVYNSLIEKTIEDREAQSQYDNIRIVAAEYFFVDCPRNMSQLLFGHGTPSFGNSSYGRQYEHFQSVTGIYREDVGYCGFFHDNGLVATIILICLFVGALLYKVPDEFIYLKYYSGAFLILNVASAPSLANYNIIPFMLCLAMIYRVRIIKPIEKYGKTK